MTKIFNTLFSMRIMVILILLFAIGSAVATFIENDYGSETAKALVYSAKWFEAIMILLGISLVVNIIRFKLWRKEKLTSLLFHSSLIFILLGAGITRYIGFEGVMHIREGKIENRILSADSFVQAKATIDKKTYESKHKLLISGMSDNSFEMGLNIEDKKVSVRYKDFIKNAEKRLIEDSAGIPSVSLVVTTRQGPKTVMLQLGDKTEMDGIVFDFDEDALSLKPKIFFFVEEGKIKMKSKAPLSWYKMEGNVEGKFEADSVQEVENSMVYTLANIRFVPKDILMSATIKVTEKQKSKVKIKSAGDFSALIVDVDYKGQTKEVGLLGRGLGAKGFEEIVHFDDIDLSMEWGSEVVELPFSIKLNDFIMKRYAGSESPSSYESDVQLIDEKEGVKKDFKIYMNHVLDYKSYRFFQSSYDMDEKGTILSVNNDPGKIPTYIGYFMLTLGLFLNMFNAKSRFRKLAKSQIKANSLSAFLFGFLLLTAPYLKADEAADTLHAIKSIDKVHADKFGTIMIQSSDGRIKPLATVSQEIINKVSRKNSILGLTPNQIVLGMISKPEAWQKIKMVKYSHPEVGKVLGIEGKRFSFSDAFDYSQKKPYKLFTQVEIANQKKPAERNQFDKDVLKIDERLNILYMAYSAKLLKMFPKEKIGWKDKDGWLDPETAVKNSEVVDEILSNYLGAINHGIEKGEWQYADKIVDSIKNYQEKYAGDILLDKSHLKAELLFNNLQIFERLMPVYLLAGFLMLILTFVKLVKPKLKLKLFSNIVFAVLLLGFIAHTFGLGLRWYVSGHAPWSDGYESMIYIAWAIILAGLIFSRHSILALSTTGILAGVTLFTAHLSWMDPQITNLVPVLKSYWLTVHVSVITASYGFLALSAFLGFITLLFFIIHNKKTIVIEPIKEASRINEMSMIIGLSLLVVGNFIGGVWANESWGRYWGWDPKETWSLISILVYTAVLHLRFIPKMNNLYTFAFASTVAFFSIIMTYFGVNFYLSGMHSYAAGDPMPVPAFAYYTVIIVAIVSVWAYLKYGKYRNDF